MSKQFINGTFVELPSLLDPENYPGGYRQSPRATAIPSKNISIIGLYNRSVKTIDSNLPKSQNPSGI